MADKFCNECKHIGFIGDEPYCTNPMTVTKNLVTGKPVYISCKEQRSERMYTFCRSEGKIWEKKEVQGSYGGEV